MLNTRSITPPPRPTINTNIPFDFKEYLNNGEFPVFDNTGILNCPPAPPSKSKEIRMCSCNQTYQIALKNAPVSKCGYCQTHTK